MQGKVDVLVKAKTALGTFLETFASQVMCADLTDSHSKEDDIKTKPPKQRAKSALHWENPKARELMTQHGTISALVAELIREYLDFYSLDFTKQIFVPESGLDI